MKVRIFSSGLTAIALLFANPVVNVHAQQSGDFSHLSKTSIEQVNANPQKNKDFFDNLRNLLNQPIQAQFSTNFCDVAVGYWWWDARRFPVSIYPNGRILADDPASGGRISASWTCIDPDQGLVQISWSTGITDLMKVVDQNRMSGDNGGTGVNAVRRDVGL